MKRFSLTLLHICHVSPLFDFTLASDLFFDRSVSQTVSKQPTLVLSLVTVKRATCFATLLQASGTAMLRVLPSTNQTCFAANQVLTSCPTFDRVNLRVSHAATHGSYVTCCRTSLPWAGKTRNMYRFCRKK